MSPKILVVDDEPDLQGLIVQKFRRQIRDGTVSFLFAHNGLEALTMLDGNRDVDMVLSDINMPVMDGLSLLGKLQEGDDNVSTVIVSAYGDMANIRTAMNRGAFDFVTKPIDFADLEATIAKTIRHVGILREARRRQLAAERAHASLSRYFSPNLAERLASDAEGFDLGGQRREIATLFTDVTGFTTLVEALDPEVLAPLLNDYLTGMTEVVFAHEGTVAKIVGDALHVLFGAPGEQPDHATRAVMCSLALNEFACGFRQLCNARGVALGATRIGVHAGPAIVGNFGGSRFFEYTAYGDTINVAARLESANKQLGTSICVSGDVAARAEGFVGRPIGDLLLKGRSEPIRAFEPLTPMAYADSGTDTYLKAFAAMEAGDPGSISAFAGLVGSRGADHLASFHLKRLLNGVTGTRITLD